MSAQDQARQFLARYDALQAILAGHSDAVGRSLGSTLSELTQAVLAILGRSSNGSGPAILSEEHMAAAIFEADTAVAAGLESIAPSYRAAYSRHVEQYLAGQRKLYEPFGRTTATRVASAVTSFQTQWGDLVAEGGLAAWRVEAASIHAAIVGDIQRTLQDGLIAGWDQDTMARALIQARSFSHENLPPLTDTGAAILSSGGALGENQTLYARARRIIRTEHTAARVTASIKAGQDAFGADALFVNINGEPVAKECKAANEAGAMTIPDWIQWGATNDWKGVSPRHVNCDSNMGVIPRRMAPPVALVQQAALAR